VDVLGLGQTDFLLATLAHPFDTLLFLPVFRSDRECLLFVAIPDSFTNQEPSIRRTTIFVAS
jgi:hypothetical protein